MSVIDGIAILESQRFGAVANATWQVPSGAPWAAGDVCFVCQFAESTTGVAPAAVVPAGWTAHLNSISMTTSDGHGARLMGVHKVLTAADLGAVVTGMNGTARNQVCAMIFHPSRPVQAITVAGTADFALSTSFINPVTPVWDGAKTGAHIMVGYAHGETSIADADYTWSGGGPIGSVYNSAYPADIRGGASVTRTYYGFYPYGIDPLSSVNLALNDMGTFNGLLGQYFRLT